MQPEAVIRIGQEALLLALLVSAPAVLAAMAVGLIVSLFQAATQIQEQTLTAVPKIVAVFAVIAVTGMWALGHLIRFATLLFESIVEVAR